MASNTAALARCARTFNRRAGAVPALYFFTDPARIVDPLAIAAKLPRGSVVVYRHFGDAERLGKARALARVARDRGLRLLIGADARLAWRVWAHGVHLPERDATRAGVLKRARPQWLVTVAAHSPAALRRARHGDAAILSPVFPSASVSSKGVCLGLSRAGRWARGAALPVIALGGVRLRHANALAQAGFAGLAAVDLFAELLV
jgi:thiamine-phosphate pyrophosphorylase